MVCSICNGRGHNRRTCPQINTTGSSNQQIHIQNGPIPPSYPPTQRVNSNDRGSLNRLLWRTAIKSVLNLKRFVKVSLLLSLNDGDLKYCYLHWLKIKDASFYDIYGRDHALAEFWYRCAPLSHPLSANGLLSVHNIMTFTGLTRHACSKFHKQKKSLKDNKRKIKLINMREENYLIYWVVGNIMVEDIDTRENSINYMGMLRNNGNFGLTTVIGHRFYLVPHRLDLEPPYHPQTDKQFFIEPYVQLNIHEGSSNEIHIDDGGKLSELNRWKFNALKLDYLIRELIKLGAKNNETLDIVLDLHEDIKLDNVSEWYKDIAGVPSTFTNIT